jgi:DNA-binding GntR family transcriptional regulator
LVLRNVAKFLDLTPVDPNASSSLSSSAYAELRRRIVAGDLKPGERLREVELAKLLGVSRTPVREAIKRLENEGFASFVSSRGTIVAELTPAQAIELYAAREVFEGAAAAFAAQYAQSAEIQLLEIILEAHGQAGNNIDELTRINRRFHAAIYGMTHNRYLLGILTNAQDYMVLLPNTTYHWEGRAKTAYAEHLLILDAIKARDAVKAEAAARAHMREAQRIRMMLQFRN